jgi:TatD DNase family protein
LHTAPVSLSYDPGTQPDLIGILKTEKVSERAGVIHCFTGNYETARKYLDLGFYISFSGIATFKKSEEIRDAAKRIPGDRLLIETDSPYLAPVPLRGKTNEPAYVKYVAETIAGTRGVSPEEIAEVTTENAERLFRFGR